MALPVSYDAAETRRLFGTLLVKGGTADRFGARQGVHPAGVAPLSISGFTLTVQNIQGVIYPGPNLGGPYLFELRQHNRTVPAAGAQPRRDIIVARIWNDDEDGSGAKSFDTEYVSGVPAASPSKPGLPTRSFEMGVIDVPASGGGNPTLTITTPYTVTTGGILPVRTAAELPTTGVYEGMYADVWDVDALVRWSGSAWQTMAEAPTPYQSYTPDVTGGGSATFSTRVGSWKRIAHKTVQFTAYLVVSTGGSGSGTVTITAPTAIARTVRQSVTGHLEGLSTPGLRHCAAIAFTGGSGAVFDRIRMDSGSGTNGLSNLTGADLASGVLLNITGTYEEA
ncbi:hypothetical protein AWW66_03275 [Micromonospora rosaria]|uniref:Uncharacterized protein n=1 Tax=Micromonospora rosaria TaxID=47874 RepID=A0A136PXY6_9ACTN|nr:hypothetical protein AWW66_03275 [Micromonospora rosaria]